ncbi:hypothetical protein [Eleftheria terrae]|uniref:Tse2 family ADP-ribosyltransferase toxin n=1 Tax=Eleftheria terrae TaxID=1597781 RepID=UPI00263BC30F|nr:hypothetical protein [Eleftheria terrae]WKB54344.1 hypothetical protein N7L95_08140 [Eleftheria terrae]
MSQELRRVYEKAGALDRYYDESTPVDLYRGRRKGDATDLMQPTLIGWYTKQDLRRPDVLAVNQQGQSPQYVGSDFGQLATEDQAKPLTADMLRNADKLMVKGCRTMKGDHRGVSVFDKKNTLLPKFEWYRLPAGTELPPALAVTRDAPFATSSRPTHYTVAPKDDMPLSLFLQHLKGLAAKAVAE